MVRLTQVWPCPRRFDYAWNAVQNGKKRALALRQSVACLCIASSVSIVEVPRYFTRPSPGPRPQPRAAAGALPSGRPASHSGRAGGTGKAQTGGGSAAKAGGGWRKAAAAAPPPSSFPLSHFSKAAAAAAAQRSPPARSPIKASPVQQSRRELQFMTGS